MLLKIGVTVTFAPPCKVTYRAVYSRRNSPEDFKPQKGVSEICTLHLPPLHSNEIPLLLSMHGCHVANRRIWEASVTGHSARTSLVAFASYYKGKHLTNFISMSISLLLLIFVYIYSAAIKQTWIALSCQRLNVVPLTKTFISFNLPSSCE
jgi:hypothetical protein